MNLLSSFTDFYDGLSSDGLFFFWIVAFLFVFLVFLTIILVIKNKRLIKLLKEEHTNISEEFEEIPLVETKEEVVINQVKEDFIQENEKTEVEDDIKIEEEEKIEVKKQVAPSIKEETGPYKKNVLREMNARMQTSPISIRSDDVIYNTNDSYSEDYDLDEVYLRDESVSPLESMEDSFELSENMRFASEIVERMEEEIKPSNIELTDYEKKQEEEAIISYDELLKVKDRIYNLTEDEETDEFIDQLKSFRLDL